MRFTREDESEAGGSSPSHQPLSRDMVTVEIVYSAATGAVIAALLFFLVASPSFVWRLSGRWHDVIMAAAAVVAAAGFLYRVVSVLTRLKRAARGSGAEVQEGRERIR
ncbi:MULTISPECIES: DUF6332 family protein [Streptomyces]|uniref:DUF6332 family protein n=1 Tax=Streptomyces TaxID=1883 RepID=UPI002555BA2B|nr:DUF6332 family protein [Streptomyces sp. NBRC 13847]